MKKLSAFFAVILGMFACVSLAAPSILTPSYSVNWNDVKIYWTDNSNWWYMDVNLKDPSLNARLHFWEVKMSDQVFTYTKQWDWDQKVQMVPWDGGDIIEFTVTDTNPTGIVETSTPTEKAEAATPTENKSETTRTVIPVVPKTGPSGSLILIIFSALAIFGGYIYIRKRADI